MEIMGMFDDSSHRAMTPCHGFPSWHIVAKRLQGLVRCDHHVTSKASPEILPNHHHFSKGVLWTITKMLGLWMFMALGCPQWTKVWALGCKSATLTCRNHLEPMDRIRNASLKNVNACGKKGQPYSGKVWQLCKNHLLTGLSWWTSPERNPCATINGPADVWWPPHSPRYSVYIVCKTITTTQESEYSILRCKTSVIPDPLS